MLYEWEKPYVVDDSKFERAFGGVTTPHRRAIAETVAWFRTRALPPGPEPGPGYGSTNL